MQKVLSCPQSNIRVFYYKRRLTVYNLTLYSLKDSQGYCAIWHERIGGRSGNEMASALTVLLTKLISAMPHIARIKLWSDSCIPQNRNSHMSSALLHFLRNHPQLQVIEQKFQEPGHSCV